MHRLTRLFIIGIFAMTWLGCGALTDPIEPASSALYVDQTTGHGPFLLSNPPGTPIWDHGEVQMWDSTSHGYGYRGGIGGPSVGYTFVPPAGSTWFARSPRFTYAYACKTANASNSCNEWHEITASGQSNSDWQNFGWSPVQIFIGYSPPCPVYSGLTKIRYCTGAYTPFDGSGWPTAVISDGFVQPGLPDGHPLNLQNPPVSAVECIADLRNYGLGTGIVMAVYACP